MIFDPVVGLLLCFIAEKINCSPIIELVSETTSTYVNKTHLKRSPCGPEETVCPTGCCPSKNAIWCADGVTCCPRGWQCLPGYKQCIRWPNFKAENGLTSDKTTQDQSSLYTCPPGWTDWGDNSCCPFENAVYCENDDYCCPNGFKCDSTNSLCVINKTTENDSVGELSRPWAKKSKKSPYRSCPGLNKICPSNESCCLKDNGKWGCCPKSSLFQIRYGKTLGEYAIKTASTNTTAYACGPSETQCRFGCCPLENGVCCIDGINCCHAREVCVPALETCIRTTIDNGEIALASEKSTRLRSPLFTCPPGSTECSPTFCCPEENAVCCEDGKGCCKNGFTCGDNICFKIETNTTIPRRSFTPKSPYKYCPVGVLCPSYMSCCINDSGKWGCCPNPSLPSIRYGNGDYCNTIFGNLQCPDDSPHCTLFGCFH